MALKMKFRKKKASVPMDQATLRKMQDRVSSGAQQAAERIGPAANRARDVAAHRVTDARDWTAPRLQQAAHYVEDGLAPKVSDMLNRTADKVEPPKPHRGRKKLVGMILAMGAAIGALAAIVAVRNKQEDVAEEPGSEKTETEEAEAGEMAEATAGTWSPEPESNTDGQVRNQ